MFIACSVVIKEQMAYFFLFILLLLRVNIYFWSRGVN